MSRADLDFHFRKVSDLIEEINNNVPANGGYGVVQIRADLAGLLVVAIAATYETCVKEVIVNYASKKHVSFAAFASRNYEKLNSRIQVNDLKKYCELCDPEIQSNFKNFLKKRKDILAERTGQDIEKSYKQILDWRHGFAHAWARNTTIEEAQKTHLAAKRVLYSFDEAFERHFSQ